MNTETAAGCPGTAFQDPRVVSNPPGQSRISYRADDFTGFRRALLRPLPGEQAIGAWRPAPGDLGLQVLEWWAYLADVLTFYNERYANESYLRTATQPGSVTNLVALTGYEPAPGTGATGTLAVLSTEAQPATPLVIPSGMKLSSTASPDAPSQTFEVDSEASFTGQSTAPVPLPSDSDLKHNGDGTPQSVLLAGQISGVREGEQLMLVTKTFGGQDDNWSLVTVTTLTPMTDPATGAINTQVGLASAGWGPTPKPSEAPQEPTPPADSTKYRLLRPTASAALFNAAALWHRRTAPEDEQPIEAERHERPPTARRVHLSAVVRAIAPGDTVLFDRGAKHASALAVVTGTYDLLWPVPYPLSHGSPGEDGTRSPNPPDIPVAHTVLELQLATPDSYALLNVGQTRDALGSIAVRYGFKDVGTIIGVPQPDLALSKLPLTIAATYAPPPDGQAAFLQDATGAGVHVTVKDAGDGKIAIAGTAPPASSAGSLAVPLRLLLNLVPVSRGTTVTGELLGSGNAALAHQSFTLSKSPLTYLPNGSGRTSTLTVFVNQIAWQEVPSFHGQAATARVFVVTRSADQSVTTITFGDGINGARLPSGTGNVTASYRYGSGSARPPAGLLTTISEPQLNLASVQNPVAISPGTDPEGPDEIRAGAPGSVTTFDRAVSATDYEQIAAQAPGVSRAAAYWTFDGPEQRTLVTIYVSDGPSGNGQSAVTAAYTALAATEDPNRPVKVLAASPFGLSLSCTLVVADGEQRDNVRIAATAAVSASAGGLFSPGRMGIGQRLYRSAIDAALMVPGVIAVKDLSVTTAGRVLGQVLDPGEGLFFTLDSVDITAVSADG